MANVLPMAKRVEVIAHLCEGAGIRPTSRLTGVSKPAILSDHLGPKLTITLGKGGLALGKGGLALWPPSQRD
jgi:hypothetical protein